MRAELSRARQPILEETPIRNVLSRTAASANGSTPVLAPSSGSPRQGVLIHNASASLALWVMAVASGEGAPTIDATHRSFVIGAGQTVVMPYSEALDVYLLNSSGAATESPFVFEELDAPALALVGSAASVASSGSSQVEVIGAALTSLQTIDDPVVTDDAAFQPGSSKALAVALHADEAATDQVDEGDAGVPRMTLDRKQIVNVQPHTQGGLSVARLISGASTNATVVKSSAGQVYGWYVYNSNAAARHLKIYNKATSPTVGTDAPLLTLAIPGQAAANVEFTNGIAFSAGIGLATTTGAADSDTGAVASGDLVVNLLYK